jgi:hypothetical protein
MYKHAFGMVVYFYKCGQRRVTHVLLLQVRTVYCVCIFPVLETTPSLHLSSSLTLAGVHISPSWLLFDYLAKMVLEFLPSGQVGSITYRSRDDKQKISIFFFAVFCVRHG